MRVFALLAWTTILLSMPSLAMRQDSHFPDINQMQPSADAAAAVNEYISEDAGINNTAHYIDYNDRSYQMGVIDAILFSHVQMGKNYETTPKNDIYKTIAIPPLN